MKKPKGIGKPGSLTDHQESNNPGKYIFNSASCPCTWTVYPFLLQAHGQDTILLNVTNYKHCSKISFRRTVFIISTQIDILYGIGIGCFEQYAMDVEIDFGNAGFRSCRYTMCYRNGIISERSDGCVWFPLVCRVVDLDYLYNICGSACQRYYWRGREREKGDGSRKSERSRKRSRVKNRD